jgi:hypothetical protein
MTSIKIEDYVCVSSASSAAEGKPSASGKAARPSTAPSRRSPKPPRVAHVHSPAEFSNLHNCSQCKARRYFTVPSFEMKVESTPKVFLPGCKLLLVGIEKNPGPTLVPYVSFPKERLVGVELNPGPKLLAIMPPKETTKIVTVVQQKAKQGQKKKKKAASSAGHTRLHPTQAGDACTSDYVRSLNDPFEFTGPRLGWGCLVPTQIVQAYWRGTVTADSSTGSCAIALYPTIGPDSTDVTNLSFLQSSSGLNQNFEAGVYHQPTDYDTLQANYSGGRIISGGIRAYPDTAMTAVPGACYTGAIPGLTAGAFSDLTADDLIASPYARQYRAYEGASAVLRPQDTRSFMFDGKVTNFDSTSWQTGDNLPCSVPFIAFTGLTNSATVFVEAVLNLEVIPISVHNSASVAIGGDSTRSKLSSFWHNVESMWDAVVPYLNQPGTFGAATATSTGKGKDSGSIGSVFSHAAKMGFASFQKHLLR